VVIVVVVVVVVVLCVVVVIAVVMVVSSMLLCFQPTFSRQLSGEASKPNDNANGDFADFNPRAFDAG